MEGIIIVKVKIVMTKKRATVIMERIAIIKEDCYHQRGLPSSKRTTIINHSPICNTL